MISIVVNVDTRPGCFDETVTSTHMFDGVRHVDALTDGIINKVRFFRGHPVEVIIYLDKHEDVPQGTLNQMLQIADDVTIHRHSEHFNDQKLFHKWNDLNFLNAITQARGEYVVHFDGDMAAFRSDDSNIVDRMLKWLEKYDYVSYPSPWSPAPDCDANWDYAWASTRFHITKRSCIDYTEILKCLQDSEYMYGKYGEKFRRCPWYEHVVGIIAGPDKVFYPPLEVDQYLIFCWKSYISGLFSQLNQMSYQQVFQYIAQCGGLTYPCDVTARPL